MADFPGQELATATLLKSSAGVCVPAPSTESFVVAAPTYLMRAQDSGRPPGSDYIAWSARNSPDFAGAGYGLGVPTPLGPMVVGSAVCVGTQR